MRKVVLAVVLAGILVGPAQAQAKVEALDPAAAGSPSLAGQALMSDESQLTGASLPESPFGASSAVSSIGLGNRSLAPAPESLVGFPTSGDSYAILSTGEIGTIASQFSAEYKGSTQFPSQTSPEPAARGVARDWTVLKLDVEVPDTANCLAFDFRFMSEEYPQFVGSTYNDAFIAEVDSSSWSVQSGGSLVRPNDFAASPLGEPISVNGVGPTEMTPEEATGTYFNAATRLLTARTPISPGAHSIYLSIFDASDKKLDSAVFLDNLRFVRLSPGSCLPLTTQPAVPLKVAKAGSGSGTVSSAPAGIECGADCEEEYEVGQIVDLSAVADAGSKFAGWSGGGCTGIGSCETTMSAAAKVTATFESLPPPKPPPAAPLVLTGIVPVNGQSVALVPESGRVLVKRPGQKKFTPLKEGQTIPVGSIVDTASGRAVLTSIDAAGEEQSALFYGGRFLIAQQEGSGLVVLRLRGDGPSCTGSASRQSRASTSGGGGRRLWGSGHGNFRTEGSYGSATVRGTVWFTEDRCNGTFFEVRRGLVAVRDFAAGRTVMVPAGQSYLVKSG
jgi:hypothetical protein